jgi:hypothetical protein
MNKVWETIKGYIWWTHERGSFHYDVMVTLILLFIFVTPHFVNYKDKPAERSPRAISGYVKIKRWAPQQDGKGNLVGYHVWVRR